MEIRISRHAKRRLALYHIDESDVIATINQKIRERASEGDRQTAVNRDLSTKYGYPLKVVFIQQKQFITVVSASPVRKELKK